ncbi:unnamed protein product [Closterium sp. NIES-54]
MQRSLKISRESSTIAFLLSLFLFSASIDRCVSTSRGTVLERPATEPILEAPSESHQDKSSETTQNPPQEESATASKRPAGEAQQSPQLGKPLGAPQWTPQRAPPTTQGQENYLIQNSRIYTADFAQATASDTVIRPIIPSVIGRPDMYEADGMDVRVSNVAAAGGSHSSSPSPSSPSSSSSPSTAPSSSLCDLDDGAWEEDSSWPLYETDACPLARETSKCSKYGRPGKGFAKLRWKLRETVSPRGNGDPDKDSQTSSCGGGIPRVTRSNLCKRVANRRIAFIGDSLSQNMFESLACMAYAFEGMPVVKLNSLRDRIYFWPKCNFTLGILL